MVDLRLRAQHNTGDAACHEDDECQERRRQCHHWVGPHHLTHHLQGRERRACAGIGACGSGKKLAAQSTNLSAQSRRKSRARSAATLYLVHTCTHDMADGCM
eukprot:353643-Chlamydomonas_euryale.AAC.3